MEIELNPCVILLYFELKRNVFFHAFKPAQNPSNQLSGRAESKPEPPAMPEPI
jgi:hypothetical protein